jgi:hypothetical protein
VVLQVLQEQVGLMVHQVLQEQQELAVLQERVGLQEQQELAVLQEQMVHLALRVQVELQELQEHPEHREKASNGRVTSSTVRFIQEIQ